MKKKKFYKLISIFLLFISISLYPCRGNAATLNQLYETNINVALTSLSTIDSLGFTVTGNYSLSNSQAVLKPGFNYIISIAKGVMTLYENGTVIESIKDDISITPLNTGTFISVAANNNKYLGSMRFKNGTSSFLVINSLNIEDYLKGVVPYEMSDYFPIEALKAQAVASRTYALFHKSGGDYDVSDDTSSQVYKGYNSSFTNSIEAINDTKGQVVTYNGQFIDALFCASDGGCTEDALNVWSNSLPYCTVKQDQFDAQSPSYVYYDTVTTYSNADIENIIRQKHPEWNLKQLVKIDTDNITTFESGRIKKLPIIYVDNNNDTETNYLIKSEISSYLGLRSTLCTINYKPNGTIAQFSNYIGGADRYSTAISIANTAFNPSSSNKLKNVVLATGTNFPDALSGAVLAKKYNAPILLVDGKATSAASSNVINYINSFLDKNGTIFILGGTGAVSQDYENSLRNLGFSKFTRLAGADRIATSSAINSYIAPAVNTPVVIATANNFPDALSISPIAAANGWPIYLVSNTLPASLKTYLTQNKPSNVFVIGGSGVVSETIRNQVKSILGYGDDKVVRLGGTNRYDTSRIINSHFIGTTNKVLLATGQTFPDALAGSVYAALNNYPIMLTDSNDSSNAISYIKGVINDQYCVQLEALGLSDCVNQNIINSITTIPRNYIIHTKGYGHGVGMSQWGAFYRAKGGQTYSDILNFYYTNVTIQTLQ